MLSKLGQKRIVLKRAKISLLVLATIIVVFLAYTATMKYLNQVIISEPFTLSIKGLRENKLVYEPHGYCGKKFVPKPTEINNSKWIDIDDFNTNMRNKPASTLSGLNFLLVILGVAQNKINF